MAQFDATGGNEDRDDKLFAIPREEWDRTIIEIQRLQCVYHRTIQLLTEEAANRKHGRPLTAQREKWAREMAARTIEQSTLPRVVLATDCRNFAHQKVVEGEYQDAGFNRRIAELLETNLELAKLSLQTK